MKNGIDKVYVTEEGLKELQAERDDLIHNVRKEVISELQEARAQGDLSENADYDAARDRQSRVESRISELEVMLNNVELISEQTDGLKIVRIGATVKILDMGDNVEEEYTIVGSVEADPLNGKLSNATPLAQAIADKKIGDVVTVDVEEPYQVEILDIN